MARRLAVVLALLVVPACLDPAALDAEAVLAEPVAGDATWTGRWVWSPRFGPRNAWVAFRRTVDLERVPATVPARIAVDSKYWLWVGGELVVFEGGLKRGPAPDATYVDVVDLAPYLRPGTNTLAVLVWYWGRHGLSHRSSGRGGLLVDARAGGVDLSTGSGRWRHLEHDGYLPESGAMTPNFRLPERNVRFDARRGPPPSWIEPGFDDHGWPAPVVKGEAGAPPWGPLVVRPVPRWRFSELRPYDTVTVEEVGDARVHVGRLPHAAQVTPWLEVEAPAGRVIDIRTDAYLAAGDTSVRAELITRAGRQRFEALGWMSGHEVRYTVPAGVRVVGLAWRESGYPADVAGSFRSSDPFLDRLWRKAARTLVVNLRDTPMDCPERERAQWWGDLVNGLDMAAHALEPHALAAWRKGMDELVAWRRPDGVLYSPVPEGRWHDELPQQMLAAVGRFGFWAYYLHTGDRDAVARVYPAVRDYLGLWRRDATGLVVHRPGDWDWADWGEHVDLRLLENAWYHLALLGAADMAEVLDRPGEAASWRRRAAELAAGFEGYWTGDAYRSPEHVGHDDDRGHALALLAGLVPEARRDAVAAVLEHEEHASPYLEKYVVEALFELGRGHRALERLERRYWQMVHAPWTTLWELWDLGRHGSYDHLWAGGPLPVLSRRLAGLSPAAPGWTRIRVRPQAADLAAVEAVVPTPRGPASSVMSRRPGCYRLDVRVPPGTTAEVFVPLDGLEPFAQPIGAVDLDGEVLWRQGRPVEAAAAVPGARVVGVDGRWLVVEIPAGSWGFEGRPVPPQTPEPATMSSP